MTREEHFAEADRQHGKAIAALHKARFSEVDHFDWDAWEEYKRLSKAANKHYGIAHAMWTRNIKKLNAQTRAQLQPKEVKS